MGIAGLWFAWTKPEDGKTLHSFTLITIKADDQDFMKYYHKPHDEKRMIVILHDDEYDAWLSSTASETQQFQTPYPSENMMVSN